MSRKKTIVRDMLWRDKMISSIGKEELKSVFISFSKEIQYADSTFETYFIMKFGDKRWEKAYSVAPAFFSLAIRSMLNEALLTLAKLYERGNRSDKNFIKLLNYIEGNLKSFDDSKKSLLLSEIRNQRELLSTKESEISKVLVWRDKLIAHNDNEYFSNPTKIGEDVGLSAEEIRDLIQISMNLLNCFSLIIFEEKMAARYLNFDDVKQLISCVLKARESERS